MKNIALLYDVKTNKLYAHNKRASATVGSIMEISYERAEILLKEVNSVIYTSEIAYGEVIEFLGTNRIENIDWLDALIACGKCHVLPLVYGRELMINSNDSDTTIYNSCEGSKAESRYGMHDKEVHEIIQCITFYRMIMDMVKPMYRHVIRVGIFSDKKDYYIRYIRTDEAPRTSLRDNYELIGTTEKRIPGNTVLLDSIKRWNLELSKGYIITTLDNDECYQYIGTEAVKEAVRKIERMTQ